jgi:hypothetical protein
VTQARAELDFQRLALLLQQFADGLGRPLPE